MSDEIKTIKEDLIKVKAQNKVLTEQFEKAVKEIKKLKSRVNLTVSKEEADAKQKALESKVIRVKDIMTPEELKNFGKEKKDAKSKS